MIHSAAVKHKEAKKKLTAVWRSSFNVLVDSAAVSKLLLTFPALSPSLTCFKPLSFKF